MKIEEVHKLLDRYINGQCSKEEALLVESWYRQLAKEQGALDGNAQSESIDALKEKVWNNIIQQGKPVRTSFRIDRKTLAIAASILACLAVVSAGYFFRVKEKSAKVASIQPTRDYQPGTNKASLRLADGSVIDLDDKLKGKIKETESVTINKTGNGSITYAINKATENNNTLGEQNVISTPKGGQFEVTLEDGTHVYLNAASSLTFPARFTGSTREVMLIGEAYFEVKKNPRKPFVVKSIVQNIEVTGTHFNVSCYTSEPTLTTLSEGGVTVSNLKTGKRVILKPGQQTTVTSQETLVKEVDPNDAIAWKDGLFVFTQTPLKQVLNQIGRWYNVSVDLTTIPAITFDGEISRKLTLLQVIDLLEKSSSLKFKVEGRKIMAIE